MSASLEEGKLTLIDAVVPRPPYELGDFAAIDDGKKFSLLWCPLCHFDPDAEPHWFSPGERRNHHFELAHGPDDVGQPMSELLPGGGRG